MKTELIIVDPKEFGIEESKGKSIEQAFSTKLIERDAFAQQYETIITQELNHETYKSARELRLKLVKVRTGIAEIHRAEKAFYLASGKYVDALKNKLTAPIEQMEEKLKEIEDHEAKIEAERLAKIKAERTSKLEPFGTDVTFIQLDQMSEEQFASLLEREEIAYKAKIEAEKKAEAERIEAERLAEEKRQAELKAEQERIEAQRLENERLKKEAEQQAKEQAKKDAEAKAEQDRLAKIAEEEKAKADKLAAELKAKEDAIKAEQEKERERIEAEAREKEAAEKAKRLAPDKEKINAMFISIRDFEFPECESEEAKKIIYDVKEGFEIILNGIKISAKTLK